MTTTRPLLDPSKLSPDAASFIAGFQSDVVEQVDRAVKSHDVVVVGMAQNPHVKRARKALGAAGIPFEYLEFGSYLSQWQRRLAIKQWSGWPTFPQVFVKGVLLGGADQAEKAIADGSLKQQLG